MIRIAKLTEMTEGEGALAENAVDAGKAAEAEDRAQVRAELRQGLESEQILQLIAEAADGQKAQNIVVLDVRGQTIVADFFVMCTGTSNTHIHSIADGVQEHLRERGLRAKPEGEAESFWVILDYGDVILHIFDEGTREFYDLEKLWADAKVTQWPEGGSEPAANETAN